jgi:hypothetical protein
MPRFGPDTAAATPVVDEAVYRAILELYLEWRALGGYSMAQVPSPRCLEIEQQIRALVQRVLDS